MNDRSTVPVERDRDLERQVQKLYQFSLRRRWLFVGLCWLVIAPLSLWALRDRISLGLEYFTWAVVRTTLIFDPIPSLALAFCIAILAAVLFAQTYRRLFGFSPQYRQQLERQVMRIRAAGQDHPLWKSIVNNE